MCDLIVAEKLVRVFTCVHQVMLAALRCSIGDGITPDTLTHSHQKRAGRLIYK